MSEPLYRVALVGCGNIAFGYNASLQRPGIYTHASAIKASPRLQVVAVCDANAEAARVCADFCGTEAVYSSATDLLAAEDVDIIAICTPDPTHEELALEALANPSLKALMIEKPIALTASGAEAVAARAKIPVAVNYTRRYAVGIREAVSQIGAIKSVNGYYTKGVRHNGSHWFDLADHLADPISSVCAHDTVDSSTDDPTLDVHVEFASGARGFLKGISERDYTIFEMDILGDRGRVRLTDSCHKAEIWHAADSPTRKGYRELIPHETVSTGLAQSLPALWTDLVHCIDTGATPISSVGNATRAVRVSETAVESERTRDRIAL